MRATGDTSIDIKRTRRQLVLAVTGLVVTLALTGASFYVLDGAEFVGSLVAEYSYLWSGTDTGPDEQADPSITPEALVLPEGMSEEFALRLWQEQVESQQNIMKLLIDEEISSISVDSTRTVSEDRREAGITAHFQDGTSAPGLLVALKLGDGWYLATVTGRRTADVGGSADSVAEDVGQGVDPTSALPALEDVNISALNTMIHALKANAECTEEIMAGVITEIEVDSVTAGAGTRTVRATMKEGSEEIAVELVGIRIDDDGRDLWLLTGFREL